MTFLLSRRWLLFALTVAVLATGAWWLGEWQFNRLEERRERNAVTERNLSVPPVPVGRLLAVGRPVDPRDEWRRVRATGTYRPQDNVVVRYQTRDGASGIDVVTPLQVGPDGPLLLVDRGWVGTENTGAADPELPAPPAGRVTVVGWVRADATGDSAQVVDGLTRAVSSEQIGPTLGLPVYGGWVDLVSESPPPAEPLVPAEPQETSEGPHFFYGLQWWFFAALAVFGFGYLAWDERRKPADAAAAAPVSTETKVGESAPS